MKILVTGSTGFIGSYLVEELLNQGHQIIATSFIASKAFDKAWFKKVEYIPYEISTTITKNDLFEFFKCPDLVIHLAWEGLPNYNDLIHIEKNLFSQYHFLNNLISNGLKKLVVTGTCMEYGMQNGCMYENSNTNPQNSYAIAKDTLRKYAMRIIRRE